MRLRFFLYRRLVFKNTDVKYGQKPIDIRPCTRYNICNLIRKLGDHCYKLNRNGGQLSELDGTEWLHPPGAPSTERCFTEMKTGFLILTGSNRIVRKIKDFFDLC